LADDLRKRRRVETDQQRVDRRLGEARCPHKLYEARLRALELVTGESLVPEIRETISDRLPAAVGEPGWREQFERDLHTYGLWEAIVYFGSYPPLAEGFVDEACELYERLAALYLEHHEEIVASDDPRILVQLEYMRQLGDSSSHTGPRLPEPRPRPATIAAPEPPDFDPHYERRLMSHEIFLSMVEYFAKQPMLVPFGSFADELAEALLSHFTFDGFPGAQAVFFETARVLDEHSIDVFGSDGQYILKRVVDHIEIEGFGDFDRWIPCGRCGEDFFIEITLDTVNASLIDGEWRCEGCRPTPSSA
jgi:hypothetical protein